MENGKSVVACLELDPDTGDLVLPLSEGLLAELGWQEGERLVWSKITDRAWEIRRKTVADDVCGDA